MADAVLRDPIRKFKFRVNIASSVATMRGGFSKVGGLTGEHGKTEYREGGDRNSVRKLPGLTKWEDVTLERGVMSDADLWNLFSQVAKGNEDFRFEVTITIHEPVTDEPVKGWVIHDAWVSKFEEEELDASSEDVLIERITLTHEGIDSLPV